MVTVQSLPLGPDSTSPPQPSSTPTFQLGPTHTSSNGMSLGEKLGIVLGIIAVVTVACSVALVMWCRIRSLSRTPTRRRTTSSTSAMNPDYTANPASFAQHYPIHSGGGYGGDLVGGPILDSANFDLPSGPAMSYHPSSYPHLHSDRRRTHAADVDAQGRRGSVHPDDADIPLGALGTVRKDELPAYQHANPGLPTYVELDVRQDAARSSATPSPSPTPTLHLIQNETTHASATRAESADERPHASADLHELPSATLGP